MHRVISQLTRISSTTARVNGIFIARHGSNWSKPIYTDPSEAVKDIPSNATILSGGFGICGIPSALLEALSKRDVNGFTIVTNNGAIEDVGVSLLMKKNQVKRMISSYVGENPDFEKRYMNGQIEVEFTPQGTMVERCRAGAAGIPAFFTRTGYGTLIEKGNCPIRHDENGKPVLLSKPKETRTFDGVGYVMENAIVGDFALVRAWKADRAGNLIFRKTSQNFNSTMAKAAKTTIVEVEEVLPVGSFDPDQVHLSGLFVDRIVTGIPQSKKIERVRLYAPPPDKNATNLDPREAGRLRIVRRGALELKDGMYCNLGIGIPTLLPSLIPDEMTVHLHSENGMIGYGPYPQEHELDADLINAGKETITELPGASYCSSVDSFEMVRGGHIDMTFLGAFQVSAKGDLANWMVPNKLIKGMGGAMDLVAAPHTKVVIMMEHVSNKGEKRILPECTMPLTGIQCVDMIITDMAVFEVDPKNGLTLIEVAEGVDVDKVKANTAAPFTVSKNLQPMRQI